jgi:hypothetical protein
MLNDVVATEASVPLRTSATFGRQPGPVLEGLWPFPVVEVDVEVVPVVGPCLPGTAATASDAPKPATRATPTTNALSFMMRPFAKSFSRSGAPDLPDASAAEIVRWRGRITRTGDSTLSPVPARREAGWAGLS